MHVFFSGLSVRGFGEELVVLYEYRTFSYWIRRADKYRSQTNAYGASKFTDFHHIVLCDAFKHFCLISLMN